MPLSFKLDEDLSPLVGEPIRAAGLAVATVVEQGESGYSDQELWKQVTTAGEILVTADKGFGDIRVFVPGTHTGIVLLRPDRESLLEYRALMESLIFNHDPHDLVGALTVISPRGVRIRRPTSP